MKHATFIFLDYFKNNDIFYIPGTFSPPCNYTSDVMKTCRSNGTLVCVLMQIIRNISNEINPSNSYMVYSFSYNFLELVKKFFIFSDIEMNYFLQKSDCSMFSSKFYNNYT